jgi:hypothetical protein
MQERGRSGDAPEQQVKRQLARRAVPGKLCAMSDTMAKQRGPMVIDPYRSDFTIMTVRGLFGTGKFY